MELKLSGISAAGADDAEETSLVGLAGGTCFDFHRTSEHLFLVSAAGTRTRPPRGRAAPPISFRVAGRARARQAVRAYVRRGLGGLESGRARGAPPIGVNHQRLIR